MLLSQLTLHNTDTGTFVLLLDLLSFSKYSGRLKNVAVKKISNLKKLSPSGWAEGEGRLKKETPVLPQSLNHLRFWKDQNRQQRWCWRLLDRHGREARSRLQLCCRKGSQKGCDKKVQAYLLAWPHGWLRNTSLWSAVFKSLHGLLQ